RLGEPALLAVGLLAGGLALPRFRAADRRRPRRHRPDPAQLCAGDPDGRLYGQGGQPAARLRLRSASAFCPTSWMRVMIALISAISSARPLSSAERLSRILAFS